MPFKVAAIQTAGRGLTKIADMLAFAILDKVSISTQAHVIVTVIAADREHHYARFLASKVPATTLEEYTDLMMSALKVKDPKLGDLGYRSRFHLGVLRDYTGPYNLTYQEPDTLLEWLGDSLKMKPSLRIFDDIDHIIIDLNTRMIYCYIREYDPARATTKIDGLDYGLVFEQPI